MIRQNKIIKGIKVNNTKNKSSHYADDIELFLEGDRNSFEEAVLTINDIGKTSGLFVNTGKTNAVCLGSKIKSPVIHMPHLPMEWNTQRYTILGIWLTTDLKD